MWNQWSYILEAGYVVLFALLVTVCLLKIMLTCMCVCSQYLVNFCIHFSLKMFTTHPPFLLVRFPEDVDDDGTTFHPEYSHQLFGDEWVLFLHYIKPTSYCSEVCMPLKKKQCVDMRSQKETDNRAVREVICLLVCVPVWYISETVSALVLLVDKHFYLWVVWVVFYVTGWLVYLKHWSRTA